MRRFLRRSFAAQSSTKRCAVQHSTPQRRRVVTTKEVHAKARLVVSWLPCCDPRALAGYALPASIAHYPDVGVAELQLGSLPLPHSHHAQRKPDNGGVAVYPHGEVFLNS